MNFSLSGILAILLVLLSFESYSMDLETKQLEQLRAFENQVEKLHDVLSEKAQQVLPPLKQLNVSKMSLDDLVEVQLILAQFYALDSKLSGLSPKLRKPLSRKDFPKLDREIKTLEQLIFNL